MKICKIIYLIFFAVTIQNCNAQKNNELIITYERLFINNNVISKSFTYNSQSAIYEYRQLYPDGSYQLKTVTVNLTQDNIREIYDLYVKLKPENLRNCLFIEDELRYSSSITFNLKDDKKSKDPVCNKDEEDEKKYRKIEEKLYEFIMPTYRLKYPHEFIGK